MSKLVSFVSESYDEMRHKVSWPKLSELQSSSVLVLVASLIFALVIGVIDLGFDTVMEWFYGL
ncbi:preprotein translocase subunit SecE [Roseivirga sp.]|uniref:preprotein translocase subunit SecE n=1 Tax=Roseivirga sp. TaxID=1964215 RepID=UPI003B52D615